MIWTEDKVLELLDMYIELTEKQEETIQKMGALIRKQAIELANLRNIMEAADILTDTTAEEDS